MMLHSPGQAHAHSPAHKTNVLFVAMPASGVWDLLGDEADDFEITQSKGTADTIALVIRDNFECIVVDQSEGDAALSLLVPLLAGSEQVFRLIVICRANEVGKYLRIRGVDRVLPVPVAKSQLRSALGIKKPAVQLEVESAGQPTAPDVAVPALWQGIRNRAVGLISSFYKNAAFVLLAVLFVSFCFYGLLIGYFLVSSS